MKSNSTLKVPTTAFIPNNAFTKTTSWLWGCMLLTALLFSGVSFGQTNNCNDLVGGQITVGTSCNATAFNSTNNTDYWDGATGCNATDRDDVWGWFVATSTTTTITYNSANDAVLTLLTGACSPTMGYLACADATASGNETITYATTIGTTYRVRIQRYNSDANMNGTICIYSPAPPPPNDDCAGAIELFSDYTCNTVSGTTEGATESLIGCTGEADDDVWYSFEATNTEHTVTATAGTIYDIVLEVFTACGTGSLDCMDDNYPFFGDPDEEIITLTGLTVGDTYYVRVYSYEDDSVFNDRGTFDICVTEPCPTVTASTTDVVICEGETTTLSATSAGSLTYTWYVDWNENTQTGTVIGSGPSINVTPTETTAYRATSNCGSFDWVTIAVVPAPTVMATTPIEVNICDSDAIIHELSVTGGTIPSVVLSETFNPDSSIPWLTQATISAGGDPADAQWFLENPATPYYIGWQSNDNTQFAVVDSDYAGPFVMESSLTSPPFSLADHIAPVNLNFYHYYRNNTTGATDTARVQISTDLGVTWTSVQTYTTNQGANNNFATVNISLNAYAGEPVVMLRFNYTATYDWYWAIDNVTVTGTPRPTTITWAPFTDLYTNAAATIPYAGENLNTVYTMPTQSITYTVTSESYYGCSVDTDVDVIGGVAVWTGAAWLNGSLPDIGKNVVLNGDYETDAITGSFSACNLIVNANLGINDDYLVEVENDVIVSGNIVVESQGALVQNDDAGTFTLTGAGTSSVNKLTALKQNWYDYTYWSSPVENETVAGAFPDIPSNRRYWFNAQNYVDVNADDIDDNNNDWTVAPGGSDLEPGLGYATTSVNTGPFPRIDTAVFNGAFNTADVDVNVYTNGLNVLNDWNFIGNPYPSAIDFADFHSENSAVIDGAAYLWSQSLPPLDSNPGNEALNFNQNDYAIITVGSGNSAGASGVIPLGYIPSGQGFFVNATNTGIVTFKNNTRIALENNNNQFFRTAQTNANRLWVNLTSDNGVFNQILVAYVDGATNGFDGYAYDAPRNLSTGNAASLVTFIDDIDNLQFAIQGKAPNSLSLEEVIPLGFMTSITQPTIFKLSVAQFEGEFFTNQTIYVKDNLLNLYHNLSASDYSFVSQTGTFNNRFEIVFQTETLSDGGIDLEPNDLSIIELNNGQVKFMVGHNLTIQSVEIYDMLGRSLYNLNGSNDTEIYNLSNLSQAAYIAKVTLSNGQTITKRAVKRK